MTKHASAETRQFLARRVAVNAFFVMAISLPVGALVAVAGWKLLNEGSPKSTNEISPKGRKTDYARQAFFPLTLPPDDGTGHDRCHDKSWTFAIRVFRQRPGFTVFCSKSARHDGYSVGDLRLLCIFRSSRTRSWERGYRYCRPAHRFYPVLPWRSDCLDRRERTSRHHYIVEIGDVHDPRAE